MNKTTFWEIIQTAHDNANGNMDHKCELIKTAISELNPQEALKFSENFDEMMDELYTWPLWGAAYVMNGGCSDDTFIDFRASLISRGQRDFSIAINNPDDLAELDYQEDSWFYEGFSYAVSEAVESLAGEGISRAKLPPPTPSGEEWEEEPDILSTLYPKLYRKFSHMWLDSEPLPQDTRKPWWKFW
ncbi:DUF4240 domain-containing protein [Parasalinivibrio latis]|uniref:DUF4240 domain-containing protein n=1 Tax=Parasalinivibrio latis TaxID=2952610 RepID=UPI0030DF7D6C